ncbi:MAG: copper homeostasis protein CutC [Planctomycetota bacterium]
MGTSVLLEVCAGSLEDLEAAKAGGADRVEVNSGLQLGGLTPSPALLEEAVRLFPRGAVAMVRPRPGGFCYTAADWRLLLRDAELALAAGAEGIAVGVLTADREIDVPRIDELVRLADSRPVVFHRAFDLTRDWQRSLEILNELGVQRVLTSGQAKTAGEGAETLRAMVESSRGMLIRVLAGSGIRADNVKSLLRRTGVQEVHGTFSRPADDPGYEVGPFRFAANDQLRVVDADEVRAARRELEEDSGD